MPRLFFATDVHGSEICWKKFLNAGKFYKADVLTDPKEVDEFFSAEMLRVPGQWTDLAERRHPRA